MPKFSEQSKKKLLTCHPDLQKLFNAVIEEFDCTVICGYRSEKAQNEAFAKGTSKLQFPKSRHNSYPAEAVDVMPYPITWSLTKENLENIHRLAAIVKAIAEREEIKVEWGGDWKKFKDYPHWQLSKIINKKEEV